MILIPLGLLNFLPAQGQADQAAPDDLWDDRFGPPGVTCCAGFDKVFAVEVVGNDVYVGGEFTSVGDLEGTRGIARWDGRRWHALGSGLTRGSTQTGSVYDIAVSGEDIYVVGNFEAAGSLQVGGIARWNTRSQSWNTVGNGTGTRDEDGDPSSASSVAVVGNQVYLGGVFDQVDGVAARRAALWNGSQWAPLAGGVTDDVNAGNEDIFSIVGVGDLIYFGGDFDIAINPDGVDDIQANNIAAWNRRTGRWVGLGSGAGAEVFALALDGTTLYAGGAFRTMGGQTVNGVARWNGTAWSGLGTGTAGAVYSLAVANGSVYAGGSFTGMGGVANTRHLAAWNGTQWRTLRSDLLFSDPPEDFVNAVGVLSTGNVFVGGEFNGSGLPLVSNLAYWDGTRWRGTGLGFEDSSTAFLGADGYAVVVNAEGQVFVGGEFEQIGGLPYNHIAMWDGSEWYDVGGGVDGDVSALLIKGDDLYVGGGFSVVGNGITAVRVAKYNMRTKTWSALGNGLPGGYVNALTFVGDTLYAGGSRFPSQVDCCLYKWDGQTWSPWSQRYRTNEFVFSSARTAVYALASDGQRLFVGGGFVDAETRADGTRIVANDIFLYDPRDDSIGLFGTGTDNGTVPAYVRAITLAPDGLYIGGQFNSIAGKAALNIARLDANGWEGLGTGVLGEEPVVDAIVANGTDLYVGGSFETAGVRAFNIARWNTQSRSWSDLGCGITRNAETISIERVADLAVQPAGLPKPGLYATGGIVGAGCKLSQGFAVWNGITASVPQTVRVFLPAVRR